MWRNMMGNMTREQKIMIVFVVQFVLIIAIVAILNFVLTSEKKHVFEETKDNGNVSVLKDVPSELKDSFEKQLWELVSEDENNSMANNLDYVVREGTYEFKSDNRAYSATFLVDLESARQTYDVSISWSDEKSKHDLPSEIVINCPPLDQMLYSDTVCRGMYNNTYSLDLYLPHADYSEKNNNEGDAEDDDLNIPNYIIHGNEQSKTINIEVSVCDIEGFQQKAMDYLQTIPIDLSGYTIENSVNYADPGC